MAREVKELKDFKTKAVTFFLVFQTLMGMAMLILNYTKK
jgi:hypothetical protein